MFAPKRLQRMMLRIQKYDVDVSYVPGQEMLLVHTLSRAYLLKSSVDASLETETETFTMVSYLSILEERRQQIHAATK